MIAVDIDPAQLSQAAGRPANVSVVLKAGHTERGWRGRSTNASVIHRARSTRWCSGNAGGIAYRHLTVGRGGALAGRTEGTTAAQVGRGKLSVSAALPARSGGNPAKARHANRRRRILGTQPEGNPPPELTLQLPRQSRSSTSCHDPPIRSRCCNDSLNPSSQVDRRNRDDSIWWSTVHSDDVGSRPAR